MSDFRPAPPDPLGLAAETRRRARENPENQCSPCHNRGSVPNKSVVPPACWSAPLVRCVGGRGNRSITYYIKELHSHVRTVTLGKRVVRSEKDCQGQGQTVAVLYPVLREVRRSYSDVDGHPGISRAHRAVG